MTATIFEAEANFSDLVRKVQSGRTVIITSGRENTPVAKLDAYHPVQKKRLGALETPGFTLTTAFDEPLSDHELGLWNEEGK